MKIVKQVENLVYDIPRDLIAVRGRCFDEDGGDHSFVVKINEEEVDAEVTFESREDLKGLYAVEYDSKKIGFSIVIPLNGVRFHDFEIYVKVGDEEELIIKKTRRQMKRKWTIRDTLIYNVDSRYIKAGTLHILGWAATTGDDKPKVEIRNEQDYAVDTDFTTTIRKDVVQAKYLSESQETCGFHIKMPADTSQNYYLCISDKMKTMKIRIGKNYIQFESMLHRAGIKKAYQYLLQHGVRKTIRKAFIRILGLDTTQYRAWYRKAKPTEQQLATQRGTKFSNAPLISFVVPLYRTPEKYLKEMIESVQAQTYENWELCLADGSGEGNAVESVVSSYCAKDSRIHYVNLHENRGISDNTNAAVSMAKGTFIAFVDHDDVLAPQAAYHIVKAINDHPQADVIYTDEDKIDASGKKHFEPNFKPDFSMDMLCSTNYICHLFVVKDEILKKVGVFRNEFDGAQDYDLIFRCTEEAEEIVHIPQALYHWRQATSSTSKNPETKTYAFDAGIRAINDHYRRAGIPAYAENGEKAGMYHTLYRWVDKPLVSVIIPNKDHRDDLDTVIRSLLTKCTYENLEIIIVENNSESDETWDYYRKLEEEERNVRVVKWEGEFNYSAINNYGESFAKGEYLLLLNNDVEVINPDCIEEMLGYAMRPDVGIVGAKLFYRDDTIQHAGVVVGLGGVAGHAFPGFDMDSFEDYMGRSHYAQNYSAVTGACMMVRKSVYDEVGGLEEKLPVAFNDVDFCLRAGQAGYKVVYNPYAKLYHDESKSRGYEDTPQKVNRFANEIDFFQERWKDLLAAGDPYYNPNLTLDRNDFSLKNLYHD